MSYLRFAVSTIHPDTGVADGVFGAAYVLGSATIRASTSPGRTKQSVCWKPTVMSCIHPRRAVI